ncbi:hypothetical protein [Vibrio sp. WXL103]
MEEQANQQDVESELWDLTMAFQAKLESLMRGISPLLIKGFYFMN